MKGCLVRHLCVVHASHEKVTRCCGIFVASRGPPPPAPSHCTRYFPGVTASPTTAYPTESRIFVAYSMVTVGCCVPLPHASPDASTPKDEGEAVDPEEPTHPLPAQAPRARRGSGHGAADDDYHTTSTTMVPKP
ncbi:hypothetical protein C8J57DRAFT_1509097 [Mycena rebaudengoi]|nr:hypothetical protein C8J57DRAFT_1509097 [Mycena rebaudengoi]